MPAKKVHLDSGGWMNKRLPFILVAFYSVIAKLKALRVEWQSD
jgi:hypothetical protein